MKWEEISQQDTGRHVRVQRNISQASWGCDTQGGIITPTAVDPQVYLRVGLMTLPGAVANDIVDFINLVPPVVEEEVISEHSSVQIVHRPAARKPQITEISVEEWCLANTRIMDVLIAKPPQVLKDYMVHTMKVCELFKYYERPSVLQFEREYRHMQARQGFRWGTDTPHQGHNKVAAPRQQQTRQSVKARQQVCYWCNSKNGCSATCRFAHVCSELRRILDCIASLGRSYHKARIAGAFKQHLLW